MKTPASTETTLSPAITQHTYVLQNGRKITYLHRPGPGQKIVFLHGFSGDSEGCKELIRALPDEYDVTVPDLPGFGQSDDPIFDKQGFVRTIEPLHEFIQGCFGSTKIFLVGHSYGGMCAFYYASHYPDAIRGIMLFCPIVKYRFATRAISQFGLRLYHLFGRERASKVYASKRFVDFQTWYLVRSVKSPEHYERIKLSRRREALAFRESFQDMINLFDGFIVSADGLNHRVPTEIIIGTKDAIAHKASTTWYTSRSHQATITTVDQGTHLFPVMSPDITAQMIDAFVRRQING